MPKVTLRHDPELTVSKLKQLLDDQFGDRYEVYDTALVGADLVIKKSAWTGVSLKLKQKSDRTIVRFGAMSPSAAVRIFFMGLIPILILYFTSWRSIQNEIKTFLQGSPELN
jgi:hypothetical protein